MGRPQTMKRVLIAEDQADIRELIRMTLEIENLEIHEAANGAEALEAARRLKPQLILLDVMMPGELNGFEVCERVRGDRQLARTRIVLLTARTQPEDRARGLKAGASEYLTKPFSPRELLGVVNRLV